MQFEEDEDTSDEELPSKKAKNGTVEANDEQVQGSSRRPLPQPALGNASYRNTAPGSIDFCALCSRRFSVTSYT